MMLHTKTLTFDDSFIKAFGPARIELTTQLRTFQDGGAIYRITPVYAEIPKPVTGQLQHAEATVLAAAAGEPVAYVLRVLGHAPPVLFDISADSPLIVSAWNEDDTVVDIPGDDR